MNDRLYRSRDDRVIAGVAAGLAEQLDLDPSLVRVGWVILAIVTGGLLALVYVVMMVVVPEEPGEDRPWRAGMGVPPPPTPSDPAGSSAAPGTTDAAAPTGPAVAGDRPTEAVPPPPPDGWTQSAQAARDARRADRDARRDEHAAWRGARRAERDARRAQRRDANTGPIVLGVILVLAGAWLLARRYIPALDFDQLWPVGLVIVGAVLVALSFRPGRNVQ